MLVSTILEAKGDVVATILRTATLGTAVAELVRHRVGRCLSELRADMMDQPVHTVMSVKVHLCSPDASVDAVMNLMTEERIRHVPVVVDGRLAGIISIGDVVKTRIGELEKDRNELMEYITAR
jgi:predicted transcriptional regulator